MGEENFVNNKKFAQSQQLITFRKIALWFIKNLSATRRLHAYDSDLNVVTELQSSVIEIHNMLTEC